MIQTIGRILRDRIADNLSWADRVAGVVLTAEDQSQSRAFVFPVADDVTGLKCVETGNYNDLLPNDAHKSVIFFEDLDGMEWQGYKRKYDVVTFTGRLRLVCWMNLTKMGQTPGSLLPDTAMAEIIDLLIGANDGRYDVTEGGYTDGKLILTNPRISRRDDSPFVRYSVSRRDSLLYPFHSFAIEWSVEFSYCRGNVQNVNVDTEICE